MTASETRVGCRTFRVAEAVMEPEVAVIVALPTPAPEARPAFPIVATAVADELQFTALVRSCVLPSLYVPVALNCWVVPFAMDAVKGVTDRETRPGALTTTVTVLVTVPKVEVMLDVPRRLPVTNPVALTGATAGAEEDQVAEAVRSCVLPSV